MAEIDLPLRLIVSGVPVSQQCRRRTTKDNWIAVVKRAALKSITGAARINPLRVEIFYFFSQSGRIDLDNIAKPICDALKSLVYVDDSQISELYLRKLDLEGNCRLRETPAALAAALQRHEDFVYIAISELEGVEMSIATGPFEQIEREVLRKVASKYRESGYDVVLTPPSRVLPKALRSFRPDLVARGPNETVVVEVKSKSGLMKERELAQLAQSVSEIPGWRLETIIANPEVENSVPLDARGLTEAQIFRRIGEAERLEKESYGDAAMLLAWSAVEAALREKANRSNINSEGQSALSLAKSLYSSGEIAKRSLDTLDRALPMRNALAHGFQTKHTSRAIIKELGVLIKDLLLASDTNR